MPHSSEDLPEDPPVFSLTEGGPTYRLLARLRLIRPDGLVRSWWVVLFVWLPMMVEAGVRALLGRDMDPLLQDLSVHARLLAAVPMLFWSERLTMAASRATIRSLYVGELCPRPAIAAIVRSAERLRDAWWPEAGLLLVCVVSGQLALWRISGSAGVFHGGLDESTWSFARVWYPLVALPLALFVAYRWFWRWVIWTYMLLRFSRQELRPIATHPDYAAGLSCLSWPVASFGGFAFALGSVLAGAWGTQLLRQQVTLESLYQDILAFLLTVLGLAVWPLLAFTGHLFRARRIALARYGDLANAYTKAFDIRWIKSRASGDEALGTPDIQSLSDLGNSFSVIGKTRLVTFSVRQLLAVGGLGILPMLPLFASNVTVQDLLKRIVSLMLRGVPI